MRWASLLAVLLPSLALGQKYVDAGFIATQRHLHSATLLNDGRVLITGGQIAPSVFTATTELFDPYTATWSAGPSMQLDRTIHVAARLWDGRVLVAGGNVAMTAEVFDPRSGQFSPVGALASPRYDANLALLPSGAVLVIGGRQSANSLIAGTGTADRFDPSVGTFAPAGTGPVLQSPCIVRLPDAGVLLLGSAFDGGAATAERYDGDGGVVFAFSLGTHRDNLGCLVLENSDLLVVHGNGGDAGLAVQRLSPAGTLLGEWTSNTGSFDFALTLLPSGVPWWSGGSNGSAWVSGADHFLSDGGVVGTAPLPYAAERHSVTVLPSGRVLVVPGNTGPARPALLADFRQDSFRRVGDLPEARGGVEVALLADGRVYLAGGHGDGFATRTGALVYSPQREAWEDGGTTFGPRDEATATLLLDGRVLVAGGGSAATQPVDTAYLYDPRTGAAQLTSPLGTARMGHRAALMEDGTVLVVGGLGPAGKLGSIERFDPLSGAWSNVATATPRLNHAMVRAPRGELVVLGGTQSPPGLTLIERISNDGGIVGLTVPQQRWAGHAAVLPDGRVFFHGGSIGGSSVRSTNLYDPVTNTTVDGALGPTERSGETAVRLRSGLVLVAGGDTPETAALYDPVANDWRPVAASFAGALGSAAAARLLSGDLLLVGGEAATHSAFTQLYDEGMQSSGEAPVLNLPCISATQGGSLSFGGSGLWSARQSSGGMSQGSPDDLVVVAMEHFESGYIRYLPTVLDGLDAGRAEVPALAPGWYRVFGIMRGNAGPAQAVRLGWAGGHGCSDGAQCGSGVCQAGLCTSTGCVSREAFFSVTDGGSTEDGGTTPRGPLFLRVGCGCGAAGGPSLAALLLLLALRSGRRRAGAATSRCPPRGP